MDRKKHSHYAIRARAQSEACAQAEHARKDERIEKLRDKVSTLIAALHVTLRVMQASHVHGTEAWKICDGLPCDLADQIDDVRIVLANAQKEAI